MLFNVKWENDWNVTLWCSSTPVVSSSVHCQWSVLNVLSISILFSVQVTTVVFFPHLMSLWVFIGLWIGDESTGLIGWSATKRAEQLLKTDLLKVNSVDPCNLKAAGWETGVAPSVRRQQKVSTQPVVVTLCEVLFLHLELYDYWIFPWRLCFFTLPHLLVVFLYYSVDVGARVFSFGRECSCVFLSSYFRGRPLKLFIWTSSSLGHLICTDTLWIKESPRNMGSTL